MSDDHDQNNENALPPIAIGLSGLNAAPHHIAAELRAMADGQGRYSRFALISPPIKNIWRAAADMLEGYAARLKDPAP